MVMLYQCIRLFMQRASVHLHTVRHQACVLAHFYSSSCTVGVIESVYDKQVISAIGHKHNFRHFSITASIDVNKK